MTASLLLKVYPAMLAAFLALDIAWLGVVARTLYQRQMGHLMRPQANWGAAVPFYLIYVGAILILCVLPAVEKGSVARALGLGAMFGLAAYAAFDLTALAVLKDFPGGIVPVDLAWGVVLTASVSAVGYRVAVALAR
ncbi:MAG: DUF2177 family protein [Gemmatimonadetes bacterium]|nr:DUF2177 family protein [Gemmatimonadota bacterium]